MFTASIFVYSTYLDFYNLSIGRTISIFSDGPIGIEEALFRILFYQIPDKKGDK